MIDDERVSFATSASGLVPVPELIGAPVRRRAGAGVSAAVVLLVVTALLAVSLAGCTGSSSGSSGPGGSGGGPQGPSGSGPRPTAVVSSPGGVRVGADLSAAASRASAGPTPRITAVADAPTASPAATASRTADNPASDDHPALVQSIKVGYHDTFDRIEIRFLPAGGLPDYAVHWLAPGQRLPERDTAQLPAGSRTLWIRFPHTVDLDARVLTPQLPAIREIRELGSVGTSAYVAIGVQTGATVSGYRLEVTAAAPPTLSVDVAHAGP